MVGGLQLVIDGGDPLSIVWQILPYALLTFGEVLVSATGLEFAYSQAPASMKGVMMSFWNLTVTVGNLWVLLANAAVRNQTVTGSIAGTGLERHRVPDVLLRRLRVARGAGVRPLRAALSRNGLLPARLIKLGIHARLQRHRGGGVAVLGGADEEHEHVAWCRLRLHCANVRQGGGFLAGGPIARVARPSDPVQPARSRWGCRPRCA